MIATRPIFKNFMIAGNLFVIVMKSFNVDAEFTVKLCGLGGILGPHRLALAVLGIVYKIDLLGRGH